MSKAEEFIQEHTRNCYNYNSYEQDPIPWLTPDQAIKAVEIARKEMIEKGIEFLKDHLEGYDIFGSDIERSVESFKLAMKYE